jgi:AraC-like DNA-binding protein
MFTSDVYLDVGFENLSHFSFAFKKQFGYSPTGVRSQIRLNFQGIGSGNTQCWEPIVC